MFFIKAKHFFFASPHPQDREMNKTLKIYEKTTHNQKLLEGMKSGLKPDISDDDFDDEDEV